MKNTEVMKERIRRIDVLFKEIGFELTDKEESSDAFSASFEDDEGITGAVFIDKVSKYLEIIYTFTFGLDSINYIKGNLNTFTRVCYEYGCYYTVGNQYPEISLSVFSKIYFSGLNYESLQDTLDDFADCVESLQEVLEVENEAEG